jgi:hypothetical protein
MGYSSEYNVGFPGNAWGGKKLRDIPQRDTAKKADNS